MPDDAMASGTTAGSRAWRPGHSVSGWSGFLLSGGMWGEPHGLATPQNSV
ncbi:hypothetical protein IFJ82_12910 [Novacetimonas hansenii]|nr:hypothetical protein [Novacetimonas hansenii]QOF94760.1 hypothetical protein IFJ82_12910 [Novacetimonas hansenii]